MRKAIIIAALMLAACGSPGSTLRVSDFRNGASTNAANILEGVALNASAGTRTVTLQTWNYSKLRAFVFYTYSAATTVTATATCSYDGANFASITSRAVSSGASTVSLFVDTYTTGGADADIMLEYDARGCRQVKIVFGGASADGSDLVNVQAVAVTGG